MHRIVFSLLLVLLINCVADYSSADSSIKTGADQTYLYLPSLQDKSIGLVVNHSSVIGNAHIIDSLLALGVRIKTIFTPEHGLKGVADAGQIIDNSSYKGIPVVSLYGKNKKPSQKDLEDIDMLVFDIQDVGVRFYTYLSTLHYIMESCAEKVIPLLILDRPNPNGFYVDGPILDTLLRSFVGMHPVPVVHGMTVAEYAQMINGEGWLQNKATCSLAYIPCLNYTHDSIYQLPIKPSPNLPNNTSIALYPSLCFLEGTPISIGRGTPFPFQVFGHPDFSNKLPFSFSPKPTEGAKYPKLNGKTCYGYDLRGMPLVDSIQWDFLLNAYEQYPDKKNFFTPFFDKLAGTYSLKKAIQEGSLETTKNLWAQELTVFKKIRKKYLLYPDFE